MRIVALVDSAGHVCCRYRLRALADGFAERGIRLELRPLGSGISRWRTLGEVSDADLVILQRKLLSSWEVDRLRHHARRLIFDFDDAVFSRDSYHPRGLDSSKHYRRFEYTVRAADAVVAGNAWLAEKALQAGADRPIAIPTCIDLELYRTTAPHNRTDNKLTMVWLGSASTLQGLELHRVLLEQVGLRMPGLTLKVICDEPISFTHLPVEYHPWSSDEEAAALAKADVGISLLPHDDWSRGKCGLKVLQYMAAGLPVVGNPVGVTETLIGSATAGDRAGFLCDSPDEFVTALHALKNPAVRRALAGAGRLRVDERYSVRVGVRKWLRLLDDLKVEARRAG